MEETTRTHDFLGQPFKHTKCKRCGTEFRRMSIDWKMPICPPCEPEDTAEYRARQNKLNSTNRK